MKCEETDMANKKLIEVALPLERINEAAMHEKTIRKGHPSALHLWWARRPMSAARAIIWASLVDDPSSHPELFPTEEAQNAERVRLFKILEDLIWWENSNDPNILAQAKNEILRYNRGEMPKLLDPFAGGGAIPLEASRLGLKSFAHDLNPIAVMINKALIEIPFSFNGHGAISQPNADYSNSGLKGLSEDVRYYGLWLYEEAYRRLNHLYPRVSINKNQHSSLLANAWIWTRTVECPNPGCRDEVPLVRSFLLSKKKGRECYFFPYKENDEIIYRVSMGKPLVEGTINKSGARCPFCGEPISFDYISQQGKEKRIGARLAAIIAEQNGKKVFLSPDNDQEMAAECNIPEDAPNTQLPDQALGFRVQKYGLKTHSDLFTHRQLNMLCMCTNLVYEAYEKIMRDGGSSEYAKAVALFLAFNIDKAANYWSSLCGWRNDHEAVRETFARHALPMVWDYVEVNPFSNSIGNLKSFMLKSSETIEELPIGEYAGEADQFDAQGDCGLRNVVVSTDPPYYDNIDYSDLSDFFYVWLRKSLIKIWPDSFKTLLVPKVEELIATPFRFDGSMDDAKHFFESGMLSAFKQIYNASRDDIPVTVYYAFKQGGSNDDKSTSGWETILSAIINAGFSITGTWPMEMELATRTRGIGSNALSSTIVLVCRKRENNSLFTTRRNLINELRRDLRVSLHQLQKSNIAPVDLAQSAIGPGMAVFSRYSKVLEADGSEMSVRSALQVINEELDLYFNEQVGDLDSMSRFCVDLYTQSAFNDIQFGQADVLARAKGTSVDAIASHGPVYAKGGKVHLIDRDQLPDKIDHNENCIWMFAQQLTQLMATGGVDACAKAIYDMMGSNAEKAKDLAYRLYTIAEQKKWANEAYAYNALVVAWPDIQARAAELKAERPEQMNLFDY